MSNAGNNSHREYYIGMLQLLDFYYWIYPQLRAIVAGHIDQMDVQHGQRRVDERDERDERGRGDHEDSDMEDVVMGGTSPD
ncbi:hypothetical protein GGI43DRAFT_387420 [Trichoderma evansii]